MKIHVFIDVSVSKRIRRQIYAVGDFERRFCHPVSLGSFIIGRPGFEIPEANPGDWVILGESFTLGAHRRDLCDLIAAGVGVASADGVGYQLRELEPKTRPPGVTRVTEISQIALWGIDARRLELAVVDGQRLRDLIFHMVQTSRAKNGPWRQSGNALLAQPGRAWTNDLYRRAREMFNPFRPLCQQNPDIAVIMAEEFSCGGFLSEGQLRSVRSWVAQYKSEKKLPCLKYC